jgi:cytochrome bd-type quinol oxidase subunit 2
MVRGWVRPPSTLRAAWVITLVLAILNSAVGGRVLLTLLTSGGDADDYTPDAAERLGATLVLGAIAAAIAFAWVEFWLASRARDASNPHRWALVAACWLMVACCLVTAVLNHSAGRLVSVALNLAVTIVMIVLLQFSRSTNDYLRAARTDREQSRARLASPILPPDADDAAPSGTRG